MEECEYPSAWLSLDEDDNDLHTFLTYVVAAVRTLFPQAMEQFPRLLKGPTLPPLRVLTNTLINELDCCPGPFILTLDDYHQIVNSDIHELVRELLRHPPQPLHLAVATRTDPAFDLLHLRAYQQMNEVRASALSFTHDETAAFLEQMMEQAIDAEIVDALTDRTEGWVTGLRLIALSAHSGPDLAELVAILPGEQQTLDYLIAEALSHQPDDVQECLLKTSILDRFCAPLCEAVCGSPDGDENSMRDGTAFVEWLISANLFTVSLDYAGEWYRYHHLLRDLLRNRLIFTRSAEEIAALHGHASRWFADNNLIDDALRHALAADDVAYAVALVSQHRYELMNTEQWNRLDSWLTMLPAEIVDADPVLLTTRAYIYEYRGEIVEVFADCARAEALLPTLPPDSPAQTALTGEIAVLNGEYNLLVGDVDAILQNAETALEFLPDNARHIWSYAIGAQVIAHQMAADIERSREIINDVLNDRATLPAITEARMMLWFCLAYWIEGDLDGVQRAASRCLQLGARHQLPESYSFGRYFLGVCHYVRNELDAATAYLAPLFDDPFTVRPQYWVHGGCALARIHHAQGREAEATRIVESMITHTTETNDLAALAISGAFQVELALMQGNILEAQALHEGGWAFYPGSAWYNMLWQGGYDYETPPPAVTKDGIVPYPPTGYRTLNARFGFFSIATGVTPAMCMRLTNVGSQYLICDIDSEKKYFDGKKTYKCTLPANIPESNFWSFTVYDNQTRSMLRTPQRYPRAGSQTYPSPAAVPNADGSTDIYFGPQAPKGKEANWIQTVPGKGWFTILRIYSPTAAYFDKSWQVGEIELVK